MRHVYVEHSVAAHPRTAAVLARYPRAAHIACRRYAEVFNPRAQNFRLQKREPALILARKHRGHVLAAPPGYGVGGSHNYYFSHMLNCVYDCRYCFLQGMLRSANYVLFVNYEDFAGAMDATLAAHPGEDVWFFSGYDCDSLAFEPVAGFADWFLPYFAARGRAFLELRTKSTQIRTLLRRDPLPNVVVAFSFTPHAVSRVLENRVPTVVARIAAMRRLAERGWRIGLRFDPMIHSEHFAAAYRDLLGAIFAALDPRAVHSVSIGAFRLPRAQFKAIARLYPEEPLFAGPLESRGSLVGYPLALEKRMREDCLRALQAYVPAERVFQCEIAQ